MSKKYVETSTNFQSVKISTYYSGIKKTLKKEDDLLLIEFTKVASIAGLFTKSLTSSAPVNQCKECLQSQ